MIPKSIKYIIYRVSIFSLLFLIICLFIFVRKSISNDYNIAPCPPNSDITTTATKKVALTILRIKPNSDLEGDDDYVPFYNNHADIYGNITIDEEEFQLPKIDDNNDPHWEEVTKDEYPELNFGKFLKEVSSSPVKIKIDIKESDGGLTWDDNIVDINPSASKSSLEFLFDLCSLQISGDIDRHTQDIIQISGGSADDAATLYMKVEMDDHRPDTTNDIALTDIDIIQVIPHTNRLIAGKPALLRVSIANNMDFDIETLKLNVLFDSPCFERIEEFNINNLKKGELRTEYLFKEAVDPLILPQCGEPWNSYPIEVGVSLDTHSYEGHLLPGDCRLLNNSYRNKVARKIVSTGQPDVLWSRTGVLFDIGNLTSEQNFNKIIELGIPYIKATYPVVEMNNHVNSDGWNIPVTSAAYDWLSTFLSGIGIPADCGTPFVLIASLNTHSVLLGYDRIMGILPNHDWFTRFGSIYGYGCSRFSEGDVNGLSLGEFAPHAVIFIPRNYGPTGPAMTLPAHELGHTFGLSTDTRLKGDICRSLDFPGLTDLACAIDDGYDEYAHENAVLSKGNPSSGYWIKQGGEPASVLPLIDQEQCNSHCFMGGSPSVNISDEYLGWYNLNLDGSKVLTSASRWIDPPDYDHLIDKLSVRPPFGHPWIEHEILYVSGIISANEDIYLGEWLHLSNRDVDRNDPYGLYGFRFLTEEGTILQDIGLPQQWVISSGVNLPVIFFGMNLPYPEGVRKVEVYNRENSRVLATREISRNQPTVYLRQPINGDFIKDKTNINISWEGYDADGDALTYKLALSRNGQDWWLAANDLNQDNFILQLDNLPSGIHYIKIIATDGIHVSESNQTWFIWAGVPTANAGVDQTVIANSSSNASITLDGNASSDPDGDPLTFTWTGPFGTSAGATPTVTLSIGVHIITLTVTDPEGYIGTDTVEVTVDGKPGISGKVAGKGWYSPGVLYVDLKITNTGTGVAQNINLNKIVYKTLGGTGTVTYNTTLSPALPYSAGNLDAGASKVVRLFLNVPSTVTKFSITENGTVQDIVGTSYNYSTGQAVTP